MSDVTIPQPAFSGFEEASQAILATLQARLGFGLWLIARTVGDDWIVLQVRDRVYDIGEQTVLHWPDTLCQRMVEGEGPQIAPDTHEIAVYRDAPIAQQLPIQAYIGMPLRLRDGRLFGTLCALDPQPQRDSIVTDGPVIALCARLLSTVLQSELEHQEDVRKLERVQLEALLDPLTQVYSRRGWERFVLMEDERCVRYGAPLSVLVIDIDDVARVNQAEGQAAGDDLLKRAASTILHTVRTSDVLGRLGDDEFGVLCVETTAPAAEHLVMRIRDALGKTGIGASVGLCAHDIRRKLLETIATADERMYDDKRNRRRLH